MSEDLFDAAAMYDEDYLHFFADEATPAPTHGPVVGTAYAQRAVEDLVWRLGAFEPGMRVLDLACGHGTLANGLAARGCRVTGLDFSPVFLERARRDAEALGVDVDYVEGDMRALPSGWSQRFDRVVNWTTAFGYFDDATNRDVLTGIARVLRPGGRLAMDLDNMGHFLSAFTPSRITAELDNGDMLIDRNSFDPITARFSVVRTVVRGGQVRRLSFLKRLFSFPELRDWLTTAGFSDVAAFGEDGAPLRFEHDRMIIVAERATAL